MARAIHSIVSLCVAAGLAACGNSSTGLPSGFQCSGQPLPMTAPALVNVSGSVQDIISSSAISGASVKAFRVGDTTTLASTTTTTPGAYSVGITSGGTPVNGYLHVSDGGTHMDAYVYPAVPLATNLTEDVKMVTSSEFAVFAAAAGITPVAGDGVIVVVVTDCQGAYVSGATVTSTPAGTVRYNVAGTPSSTATVTSADGIAYIANVAPGDVTIKATASGVTMRQHVVGAYANAVTLTAIQP